MVVVTIRDSGHIELPAALSERLGLRPGTRVALEEAEGALHLRVLSDEVQLVEKEGVWVIRHHGGAAVDGGEEDSVSRFREERLASLVDAQ